MIFLGPLSWRARDRRVAKLIRAGSATDDELFEAQYGEWPVKGLNKDTPRSDLVHFKGYFSGSRNVAALPFTMAYADPNTPERNIHINRFTLSPLTPVTGILTSRMAWARAHDIIEPILGVEFLRVAALAVMALSLGTSYRYAIASAFAKTLRPSVSDVIGEEHIHILQFKDPDDITSRRAFLLDAKNILDNRTGMKRLKTDLARSIDMLLTMMPREHYAQDHELQARLHNIMVRGFKGWGQIPSNEDELYAAMADMGIRHPAIIDEYLKDDGQKDVCAMFNKNAQSGWVAPPAAEMNIGLYSFRSQEILERFWRDYMCLMYGDLLVKYGDSRGLQRMGYSNDRDIMGLPIKTPVLTHTPG